MMKWARIQNAKVVELLDEDPEGRYHSSIKWVPCGDEVEVDWVFADEAFAAPAPVELTYDEVVAQRQAAYRLESDPLKTEAEYDAMVAGVEPDYTAWVEKVAEIKARLPLP